MGLLWTIQDFERWVKSPHREVRGWVADRLEEFFPKEAGLIMASLLQDDAVEVAIRASHYFIQWPYLEFSDPLLQAFQTGREILVGNCAQALAAIGDDQFVPLFLNASASFPSSDKIDIFSAMMKLKHPAGVRLLHELFKKAAEGNEEEDVSLYASLLLLSNEIDDMAFLLRTYLASPHREAWGYSMLFPLIVHAAVPYDQEEIEERTHVSFGLSLLEEDKIAFLEEKQDTETARMIRRLLKRKKYSEVIHFLHQEAEALFERSKKANGTPAMEEWGRNQCQPLINLKLLRALARELPLLQKTAPTVRRRVAITALLIYTALIDLQEFIGRFLEEMSQGEKLSLLLGNRVDLPGDEELVTLLLKETPSEAIARTCLNKLEEDPYSPGAVRAARLLGRLKSSEAIPTLFSALHHNAANLSEAAEEALSRVGEATLPFLEPILRGGEKDEVIDILPLLGHLPYPETVEMILSHFERLSEIGNFSLLYAMEALGSPRFIPLLRGSLKEGEPEEEIFLLLCHIHHIKDPELPRIERAVSQYREEVLKKMARLRAGDKRALVRETLPLLLYCPRCRNSYTYTIREVIVDRRDGETEDILIRDETVCKGCGALNQYEITSEAHLSIMVSLMTMMKLSEAGQAALNEGPVRVVTLAIDGKSMDPKIVGDQLSPRKRSPPAPA